MLDPCHAKTGSTPLPIDKTFDLEINGSAQRIRLCSERIELPPILIVQAGPGLPVLHEVAKFQRHLGLESDFLVGYWEQRGCGNATKRDAKSVSLQQQVDDLRSVLGWLHAETKQPVILFGISLGGTIALQAAAHEAQHTKSVVAISPDANTASSDAAVYAFLQAQSALPENRGLIGRVKKLGAPPYTDSAAFQLRKKFSGLLKETLFNMIRSYGFIGTAKALRNMSLIQRELLPQLVALDLLANPPHPAVPVHYVFGEQDPLTPEAIVEKLPAAIAATESTVARVPDAGHMVHFDQPAIVRSVAMRARSDVR
jgi:pimeloyl-ACP methyl ester carboxylesterase